MGVVYAAYDDRLGRPVAIKMIKAAVAEPAARDRLRREARSAASVNHPAICQLYEIGEENGELFLAMELLAGGVAGDAASRAARLPLARSGLDRASACSRASRRSTSRGSIHRDLKPSNIFLTPHGVKLLDFGLDAARRRRLPTRRSTRLTAARAPSSARRSTRRPNSCAERRSMRAPTSSPPARCCTRCWRASRRSAGRSAVEVFHAIMYEQPAVLTGGPAVAALDRVVHRALAKRPARPLSDGRGDGAGSPLRAGAGRFRHRRAGAHAVTRLIVLPFRVLRPDPETDFLAFSLADAVDERRSRDCSRSSCGRASRHRASRLTRPTLKAIASEARRRRGARRHPAARRRSAPRVIAARRSRPAPPCCGPTPRRCRSAISSASRTSSPTRSSNRSRCR